jgi:hypothetical protein
LLQVLMRRGHARCKTQWINCGGFYFLRKLESSFSPCSVRNDSG